MNFSTSEITLQDLAARLDALSKQIAAPQSRWLSVVSSARYADISAESIRRLISAGKLTAHRVIRGKILIDRVELDSLILAATAKPRAGRGIRKKL